MIRHETRYSIVVALILVAIFSLSSCKAKGDEDRAKGLQEQLTEQRELLEEIRTDVAEIKKVIEQARRPGQETRERPVSIDDDFVKGRPDARITMIEFSDFQCPFCGRFYRETLPHIDRDYIQAGKVRMVYRDFPLDNHEHAQKAAEAAQCAGEQGKFWEMHDKLFDNQKALEVSNLKKYAKALGLNMARFEQCLDTGKYAEEVLKDLADGREAGVSGTPTFYIGYTSEGMTVQAIPVRGAVPYSTFKQIFDRLLVEKLNP